MGALFHIMGGRLFVLNCVPPPPSYEYFCGRIWEYVRSEFITRVNFSDIMLFDGDREMFQYLLFNGQLDLLYF